MPRFLSLAEAVESTIRDGDTVALEGFTHLIPFAAGHEVIRQGRRRLTLIRMTPDLIYDQMIGMGCAEKLIFSWGGNPGVGSLHRFRDAVENGWPQPLEIEEHSHAAMANAYEAGAAGLPCAVFRGYLGVDLPKVNPEHQVASPARSPARCWPPCRRSGPTSPSSTRSKADRAGNVLLEGIVGVQKEAVLAAKRSHRHGRGDRRRLRRAHPQRRDPAALDGRRPSPCVPGGAHPSYAHGYYKRDNAFYMAWDAIARDRDTLPRLDEDERARKGPEAFAGRSRAACVAAAE